MQRDVDDIILIVTEGSSLRLQHAADFEELTTNANRFSERASTIFEEILRHCLPNQRYWRTCSIIRWIEPGAFRDFPVLDGLEVGGHPLDAAGTPGLIAI